MDYDRFMAGSFYNGPTAFVRAFVRALKYHKPERVPDGMNPDSVSKIGRDLGLRTSVKFIDGQWWACRTED